MINNGILIITILPLFNNSLKSGAFPDAWKVAVVIPVHQTGARERVSSYRPVSLLCTFSKDARHVVNLSLSFSLKNFIIPNQHGFIFRRSTATNLISFMSTACL